jgi:hypothetical protein
MLADFDNDGDLEVVFAVGETVTDGLQKIYGFDKNMQAYGGFPIQAKSNGDILIGDFDRSGNQDLAVANHTEWNDRKLAIYNPNSGTRVHNIPMAIWNIEEHASIFDVDYDGEVEVIYPGYLAGEPLNSKNNLHGSNLFDGYPPSKPQYPPTSWECPLGLTHLVGDLWHWYRYGSEVAPKVADVNCDGYADIITPDHHANIHLYSTESTLDPTLENYHWGEYCHDPLNTSCFEPFAPTGFTVEDVPDDQGHAVRLEWPNSLDDGVYGIRSKRINRYYIFRETPPNHEDVFDCIASVPAGTLEYVDEGLTPKLTYKYYLVGSTSSSVSWPGYYSPPYRFTQPTVTLEGTPHDDIPPAPPTDPAYAVIDDGFSALHINLSWALSGDDPFYIPGQPEDISITTGGSTDVPFVRRPTAADSGQYEESRVFLSGKDGDAAKSKAAERIMWDSSPPDVAAPLVLDGLDGGANDVQHYYISKLEDGFAMGEPITLDAGTEEHDDYGVAYGHIYTYNIVAKDSENYSAVCGPIVVDLTDIPGDSSIISAGTPMTPDIAARPGAPGAFEKFAETGFGASGAEKRSKVITCKPNPVMGTATFTINLAAGGPARLDVYDISGRRVATVLDRAVSAGGDSVTWTPTVTAGIYVYVLEARGQQYLGKVAVVR